MPANRRKAKRQQKLSAQTCEKLIQETLESINSGAFQSYRAAAKITGLSLSTLTDRGKGRHASRSVASANRQLLTPEKELTLVAWVKHQGEMGQPWSRKELEARASLMAERPVGKTWSKNFLERHSEELLATKGTRLDPKRAKKFNKTVINDYFDSLEALHARFPDGIPPEHVWNMDEKGLQLGGGRKNLNKKFFYSRSQKHKSRLKSDNLELVTVLECISAAGDIVPPSFCMQSGSSPDLRHLPDDQWGSVYFSDSGWTDTYNCERWIREVFIPFAKHRRIDNTKPIVLTMDGHDTHEKPEIQRAIYDSLDNEDLKIIIFCFPSKTTHKCQPLDVLVFSAVEQQWQGICAEYLEKGIPMNRLTVIPAYLQGTRDAMTKELIMKAFEKTGLHPVNRQVFTEEDFAPSRASSTIAHVPSTFPDDFPSSDTAETSDDNAQSESDPSDSELDGDFLPSDGEGTMNIGEDTCNEMDAQIPEPTGSVNDNPEEAAEHTQPISGLIGTLASLETKVVHMTRSATARLELFKVAPLKSVSLEEDRLMSKEDLLNVLRSVRRQLITTHQALGHAIGQLSASNAHCTAIHRELTNVRERLSNATKSKERGSKKVKARFVTSRSLRLEFDQEEAERRERERVATEKEKQKEAEDVENTRQIAEDALNRDFTGRLAAYKKTDLRALAVALSISDKGTNAKLTSRIQSSFEQNPDLKRNSRFSGLFNKSIRERKNTTRNEETQDILGGSVQAPGPVGDGGNGDIALDIARSTVTLPHQHYPHLPNTIASSSSYVIPTNHHFHQYPMPSFEAPVIHPQPTSRIPSNFNSTLHPHTTFYNNFT